MRLVFFSLFQGLQAKFYSMALLRYLPLVLVIKRLASTCIFPKFNMPFLQEDGAQAALAKSSCGKSLDHTQLSSDI